MFVVDTRYDRRTGLVWPSNAHSSLVGAHLTRLRMLRMLSVPCRLSTWLVGNHRLNDLLGFSVGYSWAAKWLIAASLLSLGDSCRYWIDDLLLSGLVRRYSILGWVSVFALDLIGSGSHK